MLFWVLFGFLGGLYTLVWAVKAPSISIKTTAVSYAFILFLVALENMITGTKLFTEYLPLIHNISIPAVIISLLITFSTALFEITPQKRRELFLIYEFWIKFLMCFMGFGWGTMLIADGFFK
jgi:hypothetical protein